MSWTGPIIFTFTYKMILANHSMTSDSVSSCPACCFLLGLLRSLSWDSSLTFVYSSTEVVGVRVRESEREKEWGQRKSGRSEREEEREKLSQCQWEYGLPGATLTRPDMFSCLCSPSLWLCPALCKQKVHRASGAAALRINFTQLCLKLRNTPDPTTLSSSFSLPSASSMKQGLDSRCFALEAPKHSPLCLLFSLNCLSWLLAGPYGRPWLTSQTIYCNKSLISLRQASTDSM